MHLGSDPETHFWEDVMHGEGFQSLQVTPSSRAQCFVQYYHNYKSQFSSIVLFAECDNRGRMSTLYSVFQDPKEIKRSYLMRQNIKNIIYEI